MAGLGTHAADDGHAATPPGKRPSGTWARLFGRNPFLHFLVALFVGVVAGLGAIAFRKLIALFHNVMFFGEFSFSYNTLQHTAASHFGVWIILAPVLGGLCVAWLVQHFAPEAKGHGVPEVMDAIYYQKGLMRPQVVIIKAVASALNIGSGGSVGREGPIIQMGAAFAANLSRWLRLEEWQRYALIAAGAGGGIAATFNTPIGGMLFAVELMMPEISARTLVPVMIATGTATYISRIFLGHHPSFIIPPLHLAQTSYTPPQALVAYMAFGLFMGLVALLFMRSIYWFEDRFDAMPGNYYSRHALGMLLVGVTMYLLMYVTGHYYVQGVGYATVQDVLTSRLQLAGLLVALAVLKLLVTSLTLGSGGSGGIFSPSLFIGATLGALFAVLGNAVDPSLGLDMTTAAALGMAAMVGAGTGAALTGAVMIFEMTGDYRIIIPLIVVVSIAYATRRLITSDTIYTLKLLRRGRDVPESRQSNLYLSSPASAFGRADFMQMPTSAPWPPRGLRRASHNSVPHVVIVSADEERVIGIVPAEVAAAHRWNRSVDALGLARTEWRVIDGETKIVDLLISVRQGGPDVFVLGCRREGGGLDIDAVLSWSDVALAAGLPMRERLVEKSS